MSNERATPKITRRKVLSTAVGAAAAGVAAAVLPAGGALLAPSLAHAGPARSADLLKVAISGDPGNLFPWLANGVPQWSTFWPTIYESLLWRDGDMSLGGHLIERWEVAGADIKLFLRRGITYHNGRPFDADSVRYAFEQITSASSRSLWKGFVSAVQRTTAQDSHTVTLHLDQPTRAVLSNLVLISAIEPNHARTVGDRIAVQPVGTGPYKFVEYVPGTHLIVEANPTYWGPKPKINRIQFRWIREDSTRIAALEAGEAHIVNNVPPDAIARVEANSRLRVLTSSTTRVMFFSFRADRPPFNDKRVRQALNYAIDRQAIVRNILGGRAGQVITGPVHPSVLGGDVQLPQYNYDPQKARALLREAGASGAKVLLGAPNGRYINDKQVAEAVLGYLQGVGLDASLELREFSTYIGDVQRGQQTRWDLYMLGIAPPSFDADFLRDQWTPPGSTRWNGYSNPQINKMYEDSSLISDRRIARLALHKVLAAIWDDPPWLFMYYQNSVDAVDRRVTGFRTFPDEFLRFAPADLPA